MSSLETIGNLSNHDGGTEDDVDQKMIWYFTYEIESHDTCQKTEYGIKS